MTTMQCRLCKQSIKDVSWEEAWEWLEFHECSKKKKKNENPNPIHTAPDAGKE